MSATLTGVGTVVAYKLTESLDESQSWVIVGAWMVAGIILTYVVSRLQARSEEDSPAAIKERVSQLEPLLREQVQIRSYGARSKLIEAPLKELDLDITPRLGWVRDPRLIEPEPISEKVADDIVAAFKSSKRRLLIVGEPGSGKTMAAYSLIEHLDEAEGEERTPLLVNLSAWEAQDDFESFLVDYLCSSVGYEVHERAIASAFIKSHRYSLILDGLDEIPAGLRQHFSERLDEFVRGLLLEIGVIVTCRTQEYEQLLATHSTGLGLVQAVEMLPLSSEQLDHAFVKLAERDKEWELFLSQRDLTAYQRVRQLLSNPLFLNLAVVGHLNPSQLLDWTTTEQELQDIVLDRYLDRTLADQKQYEPEAAHRYLTWIARFLNGAVASPFDRKTTDYTVFDLADLTPPDPPGRFRYVAGLVVGLVWGLVVGQGMLLGLVVAQVLGLVSGPSVRLAEIVWGLVVALVFGLVLGLVGGMVLGLIFWKGLVWGPFKRSAVSSRLTLVWPSTRRQLLDFVRRAGRGVGLGLVAGLVFGMGMQLVLSLRLGMSGILSAGLQWGLILGLGLGLGSGLLETRSVLIASRTPKEARSRSVIAALTWLVSGLVGGMVSGLGFGLVSKLVEGSSYDNALAAYLVQGLALGLGLGLIVGLVLALRNGGWFVLLQKGAHRRLAWAGNLPPRVYDFLEWGVEQQIFRRVGSGVRFRHSLIQQHLAKGSEGTYQG